MEGKSVAWSDYYKEEYKGTAPSTTGLIAAGQQEASSVAGSSRLKGQRHGFISIADESRNDLQAKRSLFAQYREADVPVWNGGTWSNSASPRNTSRQFPHQSLSRMSSLRSARSSSTYSPIHRRLSQLSAQQPNLPTPLSLGPSLSQRDVLLGLLGVHARQGWPEGMGERTSPERALRAPPHAPPSLKQQAKALQDMVKGTPRNKEEEERDRDVMHAQVQEIVTRGVLVQGLLCPEARHEAQRLAHRGFFRHVAHLMQVPRLACEACEMLGGVGQVHPGTLDRALDLLVCVLPSVLGYPTEGQPAPFCMRSASRPCSAQFPAGLRQGAVGVRLPTCTSPISTTAVHSHAHSSLTSHTGHGDDWPESRLLMLYAWDRQPKEVCMAALGVLQAMACSTAGRAAIMATPKLLHIIGACLQIKECHSELHYIAPTLKSLASDARTSLVLGNNTQLMKQLCAATTAVLRACMPITGGNIPASQQADQQDVHTTKAWAERFRLAKTLTSTMCKLIQSQQSVSQMLVRLEQMVPTVNSSPHKAVSKHYHQTKSPQGTSPTCTLHLWRDMRAISAAVHVLVECTPHNHLSPVTWCALDLLSSLASLTNTNVTGLVRSLVSGDGNVSSPALTSVLDVLKMSHTPVRARAAAMNLVWLCVNGEVRAPHHQVPLNPCTPDGPSPPPPTSAERFITDLLKPPTCIIQLCYTQFEAAQNPPVPDHSHASASAVKPGAHRHARSSQRSSKGRPDILETGEDTQASPLCMPSKPLTTAGSLLACVDGGSSGASEEEPDMCEAFERRASTPMDDGPHRVVLHGGLSGPQAPVRAHGWGGAHGVVDSPPPFTFTQLGGGHGKDDHEINAKTNDDNNQEGAIETKLLSHKAQVQYARQLLSVTLSVLSSCATIKSAADLLTNATSTPLLPILTQHVVPLTLPPRNEAHEVLTVPNTHLQRQCLVLTSNLCLYAHTAVVAENAGLVGWAEGLVRQVVVNASQLGCTSTGRHDKPGSQQHLLESGHDTWLGQLVSPSAQLLANYWRHQPDQPPDKVGKVAELLANAIARLLPALPAGPLALEGLVPRRPRAALLPPHLSMQRLQAVQNLCAALTQATRALADSSHASSKASDKTTEPIIPAGVAPAAASIAQLLVDITPVLVEYVLLQLDDRAGMVVLCSALHSGFTCLWTLVATGMAPPAPIIKQLLPVLPLCLMGPRPARGVCSAGSGDTEGVDTRLVGALPPSVRAGALALLLLCVRVRAAAVLVVQHTACMDALIELYRMVQQGVVGVGDVHVGQLQEVFQALKPVDRYKALRTVRVVTAPPSDKTTTVNDVDHAVAAATAAAPKVTGAPGKVAEARVEDTGDDRCSKDDAGGGSESR